MFNTILTYRPTKNCTETDCMEKCCWVTVQEDSKVFSGVACSPKLLKSELDYLNSGAPFRSELGKDNHAALLHCRQMQRG